MNFPRMILTSVLLLSQWVDFLMMAGGVALVVFGALIWLAFLRNRRRRRRRHHQRRRPGNFPLNPTLAQTGGLPPVRRPEHAPGQPPSTPRP